MLELKLHSLSLSQSFSKGSKEVNTPMADNRIGLTYLACVNAAGHAIPGLYLFKGKRRRKNHLKYVQEPGAAFQMTPNAYMTGQAWKRWLVFLAQNVPGGISSSRKHLLINDQCKVHMSSPVAKLATELGFVVLLLPARTSHKLQPLNVVGIHVAKEAFLCADYETEYMLSSGQSRIKRQQLAKLVSQGMAHGITAKNIQSGFRICGSHLMSMQ